MPDARSVRILPTMVEVCPAISSTAMPYFLLKAGTISLRMAGEGCPTTTSLPSAFAAASVSSHFFCQSGTVCAGAAAPKASRKPNAANNFLHAMLGTVPASVFRNVCRMARKVGKTRLCGKLWQGRQKEAGEAKAAKNYTSS